MVAPAKKEISMKYFEGLGSCRRWRLTFRLNCLAPAWVIVVQWLNGQMIADSVGTV